MTSFSPAINKLLMAFNNNPTKRMRTLNRKDAVCFIREAKDCREKLAVVEIDEAGQKKIKEFVAKLKACRLQVSVFSRWDQDAPIDPACDVLIIVTRN